LIKSDGKTLFVVTGDKGGVGKSSLARALTDWFLTATPSPAV
jgi:MinD superfamily P-loop ATPase